MGHALRRRGASDDSHGGFQLPRSNGIGVYSEAGYQELSRLEVGEENPGAAIS